MHYKQKGIPGLAWKELLPGQTALYVFDDPLKAHKLLLHAGMSILTQKRYPTSATARQDYSFAGMRKDVALGLDLGTHICIFCYLHVDSLSYSFGWSALLCRTGFCDTLVVLFLSKFHHHLNKRSSLRAVRQICSVRHKYRCGYGGSNVR
jgi:hypothetical protein